MRGPSVFKETFEPDLVPTIMAKSSKRSASGSGKEGILLTVKQFNFNLKDNDFKDICRGFVPMDILLMDYHALLVKWLCRFSTEARKIDGEPYPLKTLQHYLMGIQ